MNDGDHGLHRHRARAILTKCAASIARITRAQGRTLPRLRAASAQESPTDIDAACLSVSETPVPPFPIPGNLDGNEGHPARRFASACGVSGSHIGALMDGNEIAGAALRKAEGAATSDAAICVGAAPVLINSFHNGEE